MFRIQSAWSRRPGGEWCSYLVNLVREFSGLLAVDCVRVKQGAEGLEIGLLLQEWDEIICVAGESGGNDVTDLPFNLIRLDNVMWMNLEIKKKIKNGGNLQWYIFVKMLSDVHWTSGNYPDVLCVRTQISKSVAAYPIKNSGFCPYEPLS